MARLHAIQDGMRSNPAMHWLHGFLQRCRANHRLAGIALFGAFACVCILPFLALRMLQGEWLRAGIDAVLMAVIAGCVLWTWRTGRHTAASVLAATVLVGVLAVTVTGGLEGMLWTYPGVAAVYMLAPRWACIYSIAGLIGSIVLLAVSGWIPEPPITFYATSVLVGVFGFIAATLAERHRLELERLATRDPLTGMGNRRTMELELAGITAEHRAGGLHAAIAVLDLDHFKRINDQHGHAAGDRVLVDFSRIVQGCIRLRDRLYRMGGEEFVLVLPQTDATGVQAALAKIQAELRQRLRSPGGAVGTSIGAALLRPDEDWRQWLARADAALYCAKRGGRDRIELDHGCAADRRADAPQYARA